MKPRPEPKRVLSRRQSIGLMGMNRLRLDENKNKVMYNACKLGYLRSEFVLALGVLTICLLLVFSWGCGDHGVLGHGDTESSSLPRMIPFFNSLKVLQLSAGLHHVLVLTEMDGVFAFGDGSHGKLGVGKDALQVLILDQLSLGSNGNSCNVTTCVLSLGDAENRCSPAKVQGLDGLNVVHVSAGDDHSVAMTGETFFNRQVYSWGLGTNGCVLACSPQALVEYLISSDTILKSARAQRRAFAIKANANQLFPRPSASHPREFVEFVEQAITDAFM